MSERPRRSACTTTPVEGEPDSSGWVTLRVQFEDEEQARFLALGLGPRAEVIAPEGLLRRVVEELEAAVQRWRERRNSSPAS